MTQRHTLVLAKEFGEGCKGRQLQYDIYHCRRPDSVLQYVLPDSRLNENETMFAKCPSLRVVRTLPSIEGKLLGIGSKDKKRG